MKPRNKFQKQVVEASAKLPKITQAQVQWAYRNCIEHIGRRTSKGVITCTECGHSWQGHGELVDTLTDCHCPQCGIKLKVKTTRERVFYDYEYLCIITACEGYQVLRFLYVECRAKVGEKPYYSHTEAVQRWIAPNGKYATLARLRPMGYFCHGWSYSSGLEIRPEKSMYNITPTCVYSRKKLIPELQRCGLKNTLYKLSPFELYHMLLSQSKAETLLKTGQVKLLQYFALRNRGIDKYWSSIRICIRNGYKVTDPTAWCDYIDLLSRFDKDLCNAKYVCPADLKAEHDRYAGKRNRILERERAEREHLWAQERDQRRIEQETIRLEKMQEQEQTYKDMKSSFFGICFSDGQIQVRVLESVQEFYEEGKAMGHCVFTNDYYLKSDSLILSAYIGDNRIETVEISLHSMKVVQCRGIHNTKTKYHNRIVNLVDKHIGLIEKRIAS